MSRDAPRTLIPLEQRTWASILAVGAGIGLVAAVSLVATGYHVRGLVTFTIPTVFGYTAGHLFHLAPFFRFGPSMLANAVVFTLALTMALQDVGRAVHITSAGSPAPLIVVTLMSAFLHVAVVVVSGESLMRLTRGTRRRITGEDDDAAPHLSVVRRREHEGPTGLVQ